MKKIRKRMRYFVRITRWVWDLLPGLVVIYIEAQTLRVNVGFAVLTRYQHAERMQSASNRVRSAIALKINQALGIWFNALVNPRRCAEIHARMIMESVVNDLDPRSDP